MRLYLHHHSFLYLIAPTRVMGLIVGVAGEEAQHVVLCGEMRDRLALLYPGARRFLIAPNAVEPAPAPKARAGARPLTIGMLSNLTLEKGTAAFIDLLEGALAAGSTCAP